MRERTSKLTKLVVRNINGRDVITNAVALPDMDQDPDYVMLQGHFGRHGAHVFAAAPAMLEALRWYEEQSRLARLIHSEGDKGRNAIANDGGQRARAAIAAAGGG